jgi:hypothetical protein
MRGSNSRRIPESTLRMLQSRLRTSSSNPPRSARRGLGCRPLPTTRGGVAGVGIVARWGPRMRRGGLEKVVDDAEQQKNRDHCVESNEIGGVGRRCLGRDSDGVEELSASRGGTRPTAPITKIWGANEASLCQGGVSVPCGARRGEPLAGRSDRSYGCCWVREVTCPKSRCSGC